MSTLQRLLVNRKQLRDLGICICPTHIDRLERAGKFPKRIKLGAYRESRVVWRFEEVVAWIEERASQTAPLKDDVS